MPLLHALLLTQLALLVPAWYLPFGQSLQELVSYLPATQVLLLLLQEVRGTSPEFWPPGHVPQLAWLVLAWKKPAGQSLQELVSYLPATQQEVSPEFWPPGHVPQLVWSVLP